MSIPFLNNIIIDDAGHIQFKTSAGANAGKIETDGNNLVLTNAVGDILLGDGSSDVYIGDGSNNVDIIFEQSGAIKGDGSAVTLTLGGANTTLNLENPNFNGNISMSNKLTFTSANGYILFDHEPSGDTGAYDSNTSVPLLKIDKGGTEKVILERISQEGGLLLGADDSVMIAAGDVRSTLRANLNEGAENVILASEGGFHAYGFPDNMSGGWSARQEFRFYTGGTDASLNGLWIGSGGNSQFIDLSRNLTVNNITSSGAITSGMHTITKNSTHTAQGSFSATNAHLDLYNSLEANTDQKGSIITFTDNYYDGSNYHKTTRAGIKGGTDTTGNTADGYLEFYTDSGGANTPTLAMRILSNQNIDFKNHVNLDDGKYLMWGGNTILQHNGTQTYIGDNSSSSTVTLTGGNATFAGSVTASNIHLDGQGDYITLYGGGETNHSITSRQLDGGTGDDIRVNTYGSFIVNLDSNNNQTSAVNSSFFVGRHGSNASGISGANLLFQIDGATGNVLPGADSTHDLGTSSNRWANVYADTLYGDGSNLTNVTANTPSNMVTTDGSQTITHAKNFTSASMQHNGHLYYNAYDSQGQHYPHFRDGSASNGADINWRHYYGSSNYKTHQWTSDSSGNMAQIFQGRIEAVGELKGTSLDINGNADISGETTFKPKHYGYTDDPNSSTRTIFSTHSTNGSTSNRPVNWSTIYTLGGSGTNTLQISTNEDYSESGMWIRQYNGNNASPQGSGYQNWAEVHTTNSFTVASVLNSNVTLSSLGAQASGSYITGTGSLSAQDLTDIGNLSGTNTGDQDLSGYATETYVNTAVSNLVDSAPGTLNTLNELAAALGDDASFSTTTATALGNRVRVDTASQGLTSTQKSNARTNIGAGTSSFNGVYSSLSSIPSSFTPAQHTQNFSTITNTPTTLAGYGITDAAAGSHNHAASEITSGTLSDDRLSAGVFRTRSASVVTATDWDTLTDQGTYGAASSAGAQFTGNNRPTHTVGSITFEPDYRYGHVVVTEDNGQGIQQTYYPHSGNQKIFTRTGWNNAGWGGWSMNWNTRNMGSGSGLDADLLDGNQASAFAAALGTDDNYVTDAEKTVIGNTSGTNTGDQDLSGLVTKASAQTISGAKTFSSSLGVAELITSDHIYGRSVNNSYSHLYRFGGLFLTWDSDTYGTQFNHSITSTDNNTYSDSITINSYDKVRINIDSNNNDSASTFSIGKHGTGTSGTLLTLEEDGDLTITGNATANGTLLTGAPTGDQVTTALGFTPMNSVTTTISSGQAQKLGYISITQAVDLDDVESKANTAHGWGNHASAGYASGSHNHDSRYYTETESDAKFTSTDASEDDYTFKINDESNFSGNKWYNVATTSSGNGGLHIRGVILNHVESFASQKFDLAIQVREGNDGGQLEITGSLDVLHNNTSGTDKAGIRVIKSAENGTYDEFKVYIKTCRYSMVNLRLTKRGSTTFNTSHSSPLTTEPAPVSGGHVEIDTSSTVEGNYVVDNSTIKEIFHEGHLPTLTELGATANTGTVTGTGSSSRVAFWNGASSLAADSEFIWNSTNNRLGIGVGSSPQVALDVKDTSQDELVKLTGDTGGKPQINFYTGNTNVGRILAAGNGDFTISNVSTGKLQFGVGSSSNKLEIESTGNVTIAQDLTISGGDITLSGTGRIQGVDTVSASTDAANKSYVDAHVPSNTQTILFSNFIDSGSSSLALRIPFNTLTETSSNQYYNHMDCPRDGSIKRFRFQNTSGSNHTGFTTELMIFKNGSTTPTGSGELSIQTDQNGGSYVSWDPSNYTFEEGDKLQFAFQKSSSTKTWQGISASIIIEFEQM